MGKDTKAMNSRIFFDCHLHLMNLKSISYTPLVQSVLSAPLNAVTSGFLSPVYLTQNESRLKDNIANALVCFESPISDTIENLYNDLCGALDSNVAFINKDNKFVFRGRRYDAYALIPLCIDFSTKENTSSYYKQKYSDLITPFAIETIEEINKFKTEHPDAILEFYPFLGINPIVHSKEKIKSLLEEFCSPNKKDRFYGIKLYPPLNSDPWPIHDKDEWEKTEIIYNFAEEHSLPVTTHCDNQGFRVTSPKEAWKFTNPESWKYVISSHKKLRLNFAHFGRFYANDSQIIDRVTSQIMQRPSLGHNKWTETIISYIQTYDNVYTDISFSFLDKAFVKSIASIMLNKTPISEKLKTRIMFGTDFAISLLKTSSYSKYLSDFESSIFANDTVEAMTGENVKRFLFGE